MQHFIGVVADDTTGANDIGIMFRRGGYSAKVYFYSEEQAYKMDTNVVIVDTDSRLDSPEVSYNKVYNATEKLKEAGCKTFYNKTCSVFRGNIGVEFDAMLDALEEEFAVISLAYPLNGRKTVHGIHTVHGKKLEQSEFAKDPVHPTTESSLVSILQKQTARLVSFIDIDVVRQGPARLTEEIEKKKRESNYCIIDSETQQDLQIVAEAIKDIRVICGSSALGEELPHYYSEQPIPTEIDDIKIENNQGVLVVAGSLTPQTKSQILFLKNKEIEQIIIDSRQLISSNDLAEIREIVEQATSILLTGNDVLIMPNNRDEVVKETKRIGEEKGYTPLETSKMVSAMLAEITAEIVQQISLKKLIVAGGDTSGTVIRKLRLEGNYILEEVDIGVPSIRAMGEDMFMVLKSGSFGKESFLMDAIDHLRNLTLVTK
ncbi:four-carbon acid sugar kinase family protein [Psychrobacillus sp. NPDC093180]|uniref:four-carbon acid sugar kinase family protein n=1 Tax=Psychrobacillus sp. NPDC093180 TaxID=3364489 RepID=UPI003814D074